MSADQQDELEMEINTNRCAVDSIQPLLRRAAVLEDVSFLPKHLRNVHGKNVQIPFPENIEIVMSV